MFKCADEPGSAYLFDRQGDVFQYAIFYLQLIHHWSVGSSQHSQLTPYAECLFC